MTIKPTFELVEIAGEYMLVPIGDAVASFKGILALNDAAGFLLSKMNVSKTKEEMISLLIGEYKVDRTTAERDLEILLTRLFDFGVIEE